jgi:hypothetical protein
MADATALERSRLTIRGVRAVLALEDGRITLTKDGPPQASVTFTVAQVRGTVLEPGSRGTRGWIHIAVVGGSLAPPGELAAMSDPYTLPITTRGAVTARRLARMVEKHLRERGLPPEPAFAHSAAVSGRYSSGVSLTRPPGIPGDALEVRADDPAPRQAAGSAPTRVVTTRPDGGGATSTDERSAAATLVAEAAIDARAASDARAAPRVLPAAGVLPVVLSLPGPITPPVLAAPVPTAPPPPGPPGPPEPPVRPRELVVELRQLGELHAAGVLTDAEFEQAKARVLR